MSVQTEVKKTKFRSLTANLVITFLVLSVAILLTISGLSLYFSLISQQKFIFEHQHHIAHDAAYTVKNFVQEKFHILKSASNFGNLVIARKEEQKLVLDKLMGMESAFRQLVLLNAQKQELVRVSRLSNLMSLQLTEQALSELFSQVNQEETYISSIYIDEITSEPLVIMAVPVTDVFGNFKGILMAEVNLKFMWDLVGGIKIGENGLAYVVDGQGNLIAFGDFSRVLKRENLIRLEEVSKFISHKGVPGEAKANISRGILDTYVVTSHMHLGASNWAIVLELPVEEAYDSITHQIIISVLIILLTFGLAVVIVIYLSKRITKPIKELTVTAQTIAGGDLTKRAKISSRDEVGQLASSFNKMVESLEREQAFSKNIVQTMPISLVVVNSDTIIRSVNKTTCELLGYTEEELVGQPVEKVFDHAVAGAVLRDRRPEELIKGITIKDKQLMFRTKKDQEIPLAISESMVRNEEGKLEYVVVIAKDMREILKLEEEKRKAEVVAAEKEIKNLKKLDKLKDEFLNIATHELKTPLTSIIGLSEIIKEQNHSLNSECQKYLNIINTEGLKLDHIIKRILTVTRFESGKETVHLEQFNLPVFVSSLLPNLNIIAKEKKSRIVFKIEKKSIVIRSDKEKISQVIYNFVDNAIKYGPEGQTVTISIVEAKEDQIKIAVTDQGPGITPELQKRLFTKFSQLEPSLTRSRGGTGLGLYICKLIVDRLGGKIGVKSVFGKGSTFCFTLPIRKAF